jgi:hypothetical protein
MRRKARSCRQRSRGSDNNRTSLGQTDAIPGFPWPPPLLAELREIFRLPPRPKLVEPPKADA